LNLADPEGLAADTVKSAANDFYDQSIQRPASDISGYAHDLVNDPAYFLHAIGPSLVGLGMSVPTTLVGTPAAESGQTTAELTAAAGRAVKTVGPGRGPVYGTTVHSAFEAEVNALGDANLATEQSYLNGNLVSQGTPGSVRLDVVEGPLDAPTCCYDLKTGSATLTPGRIGQIQANIPGGANVPVVQITPP